MKIPLLMSALLASSVLPGCSGPDSATGNSDAAHVTPSDAIGDSQDGGPDEGNAETGADSESASDDAPSDAPPSTCPISQTKSFPAGSVHSAGFSGSDTAYFTLFGVPCQAASDCVPACVAAGGTMASCASGSECVPSGTDGGLGCLPPTYWLTVGGALSESGMMGNAAELVLVAIPYDDPLVLTKFGVSIPDDAIITGIQFKVGRSTLAGNAADDVVRVLKNGAPVGANHGGAGAWPLEFADETYGGAYDSWEVSWTPADVRSDGFGISIAPKYKGPSAGNERAYIDSVRVTVFYSTPCE